MSVELKGVESIVKQLESKYGISKMREVEDKALNVGVDYFIEKLQTNFESFKDTGASINEMTKTKPYLSNASDARAISIKWVGPMERYKLIHLNEHGYTKDGKKINPRGFGVIAKTLEESKAIYRQIIINEMRKRL